MKITKTFILLSFLVLLSLSIASANENVSDTTDDNYQSAIQSDIPEAVNNKEYNVKTTSEINSIVNDDNITADEVTINVDENDFEDDVYLDIDFGYTSNQTFKKLIINANNNSFDLGFTPVYWEDYLHGEVDQDYGKICVGNEYTLIFNNIILEEVETYNKGRVIFNHSALRDTSEQEYATNFRDEYRDNYGKIWVIDSHIDCCGDLFINRIPEASIIIENSILTDYEMYYATNVAIINSTIENNSFIYASDNTNITGNIILSSYIIPVGSASITNNVFTKDSSINSEESDGTGRENEEFHYPTDIKNIMVNIKDNKFTNNTGTCLISLELATNINNNTFENNYVDDLIDKTSQYVYDDSGDYSSFDDEIPQSIISSNIFQSNVLSNSLISSDYPLNINSNEFRANKISSKNVLINILEIAQGYSDEKGVIYYPHKIIGIINNTFNDNEANFIVNYNENYEVNVQGNVFTQNNVLNEELSILDGENITDVDNIYDSNYHDVQETFITIDNLESLSGELFGLNITVTGANATVVDGGFVQVYFDDDAVIDYLVEDDGTIISLVNYDEDIDSSEYIVKNSTATIYLITDLDMNNYDKIIVEYSGMGKYLPSSNENAVIDIKPRNATITVNSQKVILDDEEAIKFIVTITDDVDATNEYTHSSNAEVSFDFGDILDNQDIFDSVDENNQVVYYLKNISYLDYGNYTVNITYSNELFYNDVIITHTFAIDDSTTDIMEYSDDEDYSDEDYSDDEYSDDEYSDDEYSDDEYSDDEYSDDEYSDEEEIPGDITDEIIYPSITAYNVTNNVTAVNWTSVMSEKGYTTKNTGLNSTVDVYSVKPNMGGRTSINNNLTQDVAIGVGQVNNNTSNDNSTNENTKNKINNDKTTRQKSYKVNKKHVNTQSNKVTLKVGTKVSLLQLNNIFAQIFDNQTLLIYIDGVLVYNGTVGDDLSEILFDITGEFKGNHVIKVISDGKTYTKEVVIN